MTESEIIEFKKSLAELSEGLNSVAAIFKKAIINAFCHRDYRDPDEVRIAVFPDRVEVRNPGTLIPDKPNSRLQRYRLTPKGRTSSQDPYYSLPYE